MSGALWRGARRGRRCASLWPEFGPPFQVAVEEKAAAKATGGEEQAAA